LIFNNERKFIMTAVFWVAAFCAGMVSCNHLAGVKSRTRILRVGFAIGFCCCAAFGAIPGVVSLLVDGNLGDTFTRWLALLGELGIVGGAVSALTALIVLRLTRR
jgi:hypothetical protein